MVINQKEKELMIKELVDDGWLNDEAERAIENNIWIVELYKKVAAKIWLEE